MKNRKKPYPENLFSDMGYQINLPQTLDQEEGLVYAIDTYLSERCKRALFFYYEEQKSFKEAATSMGISSARVQQLRDRALSDLSHAKPLGYIVFGRKCFEKILLKKEYALNGFLTLKGRAFVFGKAKKEAR